MDTKLFLPTAICVAITIGFIISMIAYIYIPPKLYGVQIEIRDSSTEQLVFTYRVEYERNGTTKEVGSSNTGIIYGRIPKYVDLYMYDTEGTHNNVYTKYYGQDKIVVYVRTVGRIQ